MNEPPRPNKLGPPSKPRSSKSSNRRARPPDSSRRDPLIGQTINEKFTITSVIARGGMGKVYKAVQAPLGRVCAIKVLCPKYDQDEDPEFQRRFFREASTASKLNHPNTVTIFDYGRDGDIYYIAMEYVRGRTLYQILRQDGPMDEESVCHILREVGRSLREAHVLGVIHRDMKPANIVVTTHGEELALKVLDFGLVKKFKQDDSDDLTQEGLFMGSPKYMAPEQILGNPVSPKTDIYALGVVAYELLTGEPPFDRGNSVKTLMAHVNDPPPPMKRMLPSLRAGGSCIDLVMRCIEKNPDDRFADIDELLHALATIDGIAPSRRPSASGPHVRPPFSSSDFSKTELVSARGSDPWPSAESEQGDTVRDGVPGALDLPDALEFQEPPSSDKPFMPSATPAPMAHPQIAGLAPDRFRVRSLGGVVLGAALLMGLASTGVFSTDEEAGRAEPGLAAVIPANAILPEESPKETELLSTEFRAQTVPPGASVYEGKTLRCDATPCVIRSAASDSAELSLIFRKEGYQTREVQVGKRTEPLRVLLSKVAVSKRVLPRSAADGASPKKNNTPSGYKASPY